jgi:hypothetical protein
MWIRRNPAPLKEEKYMNLKNRSCLQLQEKIQKIFSLYVVLAHRWIKKRQKFVKSLEAEKNSGFAPDVKIAERLISHGERAVKFDRVVFWVLSNKELADHLLLADYTNITPNSNICYLVGSQITIEKELSAKSALQSFISGADATNEINAERFDEALEIVRRKDRFTQILRAVGVSHNALIEQIWKYAVSLKKGFAKTYTVLLGENTYHFGNWKSIQKSEGICYIQIEENDRVQEVKLVCG